MRDQPYSTTRTAMNHCHRSPLQPRSQGGLAVAHFTPRAVATAKLVKRRSARKRHRAAATTPSIELNEFAVVVRAMRRHPAHVCVTRVGARVDERRASTYTTNPTVQFGFPRSATSQSRRRSLWPHTFTNIQGIFHERECIMRNHVTPSRQHLTAAGGSRSFRPTSVGRSSER
jgi:hypothetical protein